MMNTALLSRRFARHEQKILRVGALIAWILLASCVITFFKLPHGFHSYIGFWRSGSGRGGGATSNGRPAHCNRTALSDFCDLAGDIRVDGTTGTVFVVLSHKPPKNVTWSIRPYARKSDATAMNNVRPWQVKNVYRGAPWCSQVHTVPGILFSTGGYSGNIFHDFADILVPLFAEAKPFNGEVKFLITDSNNQPTFTRKFRSFLRGLSVHERVDIDNQKPHTIHCFSSLLVGHKHRSYKELSLDEAGTSHTMRDFMGFARSSYRLPKDRAVNLEDSGLRTPRLLIIERKNSRVISNVNALDDMARRLGFKVMAHELDGEQSEIAQFMNACDVVVGVYGVGLTHSVFLPENAVMIQIIPFGVPDWVTSNSFGEPSRGMSLKYLEYSAALDESSLVQQYPADHEVITNPKSILSQGWGHFRTTYFSQNITLNITRFRSTLEEAMELLR